MVGCLELQTWKSVLLPSLVALWPNLTKFVDGLKSLTKLSLKDHLLLISCAVDDTYYSNSDVWERRTKKKLCLENPFSILYNGVLLLWNQMLPHT